MDVECVESKNKNMQIHFKPVQMFIPFKVSGETDTTPLNWILNMKNNSYTRAEEKSGFIILIVWRYY